MKNTRRKNSRRKNSRRKNSRRKNLHKLKGGMDPTAYETEADLSADFPLYYGEESFQELARLLISSERTKHGIVIMGQHGEMGDRNFYIPDGIEILMKASIGTSTMGYPNYWDAKYASNYFYAKKICNHIKDNNIFLDGCINPSLINGLRNEHGGDIANINLKIYGKSDGRVEFPEHLKEGEVPKQSLTPSEILGLDDKTLGQYYANEVIMGFDREEFYKKHGLLFLLYIRGRTHPIKLTLLLLTEEEILEEFNGPKQIRITERVIQTLKQLRDLTITEECPLGHEFLVYFDECRIKSSPLNRELSKKTDKSIECWLKWNRGLIIDNHTAVVVVDEDGNPIWEGEGGGEGGGEEFYEKLKFHLLTKFSNMTEIYNLLENYDDFPLYLLSDNKDKIIDYILLACFLSKISDEFDIFMEQIIKRTTLIYSKRDKNGDTPLLIALSNEGNKETVELLIEMGADVNVQNDLGITPLIIAISDGDRDMAKLLLDSGAHADC